MKVVFLLGPTASGKTDLGIQVAQSLQTEIISCDSVQVYQHVQVGSAMPTPQEQKQVFHHLINFLNPLQKYTAGDFRRDSLKILNQANENGKKYFLIVGGTGFYAQALEKGMYDVPQVKEEIKNQLRMKIQAGESKKLYEELLILDSDIKEWIHENDAYRIVRAWEIYLSTGSLPSVFKKTQIREAIPYPYIKFALYLEKEKMRKRVEIRCKKMLEEGILQEAQWLTKNGFETSPIFSSVGYREVLEHLKHPKSISELTELMVTSTMQLIKKQMTWLKREKDIVWLDGDLSQEVLVKKIISQVL